MFVFLRKNINGNTRQTALVKSTETMTFTHFWRSKVLKLFYNNNVRCIPAAEYRVGNQSVMCISCLDTLGFCWKRGVQISDTLLTPPCHNVFFTCDKKLLYEPMKI